MIVLICVCILTTPDLFMPEHRQYRAITVYSEIPIGQEIDSMMAAVFERLDAVPVYDPKKNESYSLLDPGQVQLFFPVYTEG